MTAIVLLYGLYSSEKKSYQKYLDFIATVIKQQNPTEVILCGGFTDPKRPNESEASTAKDYLTKMANFNNYLLEEKSLNTNQNIEFAAKMLDKEEEIVIYCDLSRLAKVAWISLHYVAGLSQQEIYKLFLKTKPNNSIKYKNCEIVGFAFPGETINQVRNQTFASIVDVLALYDEELEKLNLEKRKKEFELDI